MKNKCADISGCVYSKAMNQPYPRLCIKCGHPEESAVDNERMSARNTRKFELIDLGQLLTWLHHRNEYVDGRNSYRDFSGNEVDIEYAYAMIEECNKNIKKILQLT